MTITEKFKELNISPQISNDANLIIRSEIEKLNNKSFIVNPFYSEVDIEILVLRYLERWVELIKKVMNDSNLRLRQAEAEHFAINTVVKEIQTLGNALKATVNNTGKECLWCKKFIFEEDDFCSPECLEFYANDFLKQQDLP